MPKHVFPIHHFENGTGFQNRRELRRALAARLGENVDVFPAVEGSLMVRRMIALIEVPFAFDLALVPNHIAAQFKAKFLEQAHGVGTKDHALLAHRGEHHVVLVVEVVKNIEQESRSGPQRAKYFLRDTPHIMEITVDVRLGRVAFSVVVGWRCYGTID